MILYIYHEEPMLVTITTRSYLEVDPSLLGWSLRTSVFVGSEKSLSFFLDLKRIRLFRALTRSFRIFDTLIPIKPK